MRKKKIDGKSFDDILEESKSTKDKSVVKKKINFLEKLMHGYLNIQKEQIIAGSDRTIENKAE